MNGLFEKHKNHGPIHGVQVMVEPHRHEGIFIARGKEDALVTKNMVPGESVYGEKRVSVEVRCFTSKRCDHKTPILTAFDQRSQPVFSSVAHLRRGALLLCCTPLQPVLQRLRVRRDAEVTSGHTTAQFPIGSRCLCRTRATRRSTACLRSSNRISIALFVQNEGDKTEYRLWNPFRSKLAAAVLAGLDNIYIKPGMKLLYLGAASGTSVSHCSDIVGPEGALPMPCLPWCCTALTLSALRVRCRCPVYLCTVAPVKRAQYCTAHLLC